MPDPATRNNNDHSTTAVDDSAQVFGLSTDRDEESASIQKISKWLELADIALVVTPHRKRA
jgi:hypothetical protein